MNKKVQVSLGTEDSGGAVCPCCGTSLQPGQMHFYGAPHNRLGRTVASHYSIEISGRRFYSIVECQSGVSSAYMNQRGIN